MSSVRLSCFPADWSPDGEVATEGAATLLHRSRPAQTVSIGKCVVQNMDKAAMVSPRSDALFSFFRRDYGAASLLDMVEKRAISGIDLVTTTIILTLFVLCIAQFLMMIRQYGWRVAVSIFGFLFPFAFFRGYISRRLLLWLHRFGSVS